MGEKKVQYVVTAPYVMFKTNTPEGPRLSGYHVGAPVPDDATEEAIEHHLRNNLIAPLTPAVEAELGADLVAPPEEPVSAPKESTPAPKAHTPVKK